MKQITAEQLAELFNGQQKTAYKKKGKFIFREAVAGETVLTIVSGKLETIKTAGAGECVMRNIMIGSSAETYIIPRETFIKRYKIDSDRYLIDGLEWTGCSAEGRVNAFEYKGETISFKAPWGEDMLCEEGDYIANPIGGAQSDIYRIERQTFLDTYGAE